MAAEKHRRAGCGTRNRLGKRRHHNPDTLTDARAVRETSRKVRFDFSNFGFLEKRWAGLHKPDSVPSALRPPVRSFVCQRLAAPASARAGCDYYPESSTRPPERTGLRPGGPFSCSVLHRMGFVVPPSSRLERWALTPPFHPCRPLPDGGLFSVTLSVTPDLSAAPTLARGMLPCGVRTFLPSA